jgi:hypothetical protein
MMVGLLVVAFRGLKYLYWELEHLPAESACGAMDKVKEKKFDWRAAESYIGTIVIIAAFVAAAL